MKYGGSVLISIHPEVVVVFYSSAYGGYEILRNVCGVIYRCMPEVNSSQKEECAD